MNIFPDFLVQYKTGIRFFCLLPSLPSHLGNSAELTEFHRFIPSFTYSKHTDVSGVGIDSVSTEAVTTRPSRIGFGRFFEPCLVLSDRPAKLFMAALFTFERKVHKRHHRRTHDLPLPCPRLLEGMGCIPDVSREEKAVW